jgi:hypothetical protein
LARNFGDGIGKWLDARGMQCKTIAMVLIKACKRKAQFLSFKSYSSVANLLSDATLTTWTFPNYRFLNPDRMEKMSHWSGSHPVYSSRLLQLSSAGVKAENFSENNFIGGLVSSDDELNGLRDVFLKIIYA